MKYEHYTPEAMILANGKYPSHPLPLQVLENAGSIVCHDGTANEYILRGRTLDVVIDDGDSLSPEYEELFSPIVHQIADQETNDQTRAVRFLRKRGSRRIAIVEATGKRKGHTLGNIGLLIDYMKGGIEVRTITDYGTFIPAKDTQAFASHPGQQVSIFNFGMRGLQGEELAYPLSDFINQQQGTLSGATANEFTVHCAGEYSVFLASIQTILQLSGLYHPIVTIVPPCWYDHDTSMVQPR